MEKKEQTPQIPLLRKKSTYKLKIPAKVENMIRLLCSEISQVEWSGVLFYTYKGSFEKQDLEITCQDICLMDIGSSGFTSFTESPDIINYQVEHSLLDCQIGLIHSHNSMDSFFSGTDLNTLRKEGSTMNNFVSLIVNNAGKYTAAITKKIKSKREIKAKESYAFFGEGTIKINDNKYQEDIEEIHYHYLDISKEEGENNELLNRVATIKKTKTSKPKDLFNQIPYTPSWQTKQDDEVLRTKLFGTPPKKEEPKLKNKSYMPSLFDSWPQSEELGIPYGEIQLNPSVVESAALQLVTGSVMVTNQSKITLESWIPKMDNLFAKRFSSLEEYSLWLDTWVESILMSTYDDTQEGLDDDTMVAVLAYAIQEKLSEYEGQSKYLSRITDLLNNYII